MNSANTTSIIGSHADSNPIDIACPGCFKSFTVPLAMLHREGSAVCPSCGHREDFDEAALEAIEELELQAAANEELGPLLERLVTGQDMQ